jgi:hypothetical protein
MKNEAIPWDSQPQQKAATKGGRGLNLQLTQTIVLIAILGALRWKPPLVPCLGLMHDCLLSPRHLQSKLPKQIAFF